MQFLLARTHSHSWGWLVGCCCLTIGPLPLARAEAPSPSGPRLLPHEIRGRAFAATVRIRAEQSSQARSKTAHGAGVCLSHEGLIVTALHLVEGAERIVLWTGAGREWPARLVAAEPALDLAFLDAAPGSSLEAAVCATRTPAHAKVLVIGNPMGKGQRILEGSLGPERVVRWCGRQANLQTVQATFVGGNSGGGTFLRDSGELLGINVARSSQARDRGYMVPIARVLAIAAHKGIALPEVIESEQIAESLGTRLRPVRLGGSGPRGGLLVLSVQADGPAHRAGWMAGDVVLGLGERPVHDRRAVCRALSEPMSGTPIRYRLVRRQDMEPNTGHACADASMTTKLGPKSADASIQCYSQVETGTIAPVLPERRADVLVARSP